MQQKPLWKYTILPTRIGIDEVRSYTVLTFGWKAWRETSTHLQETIEHLRQFPESGHVPAELEAFVDDRFRQAIAVKNRIIYHVQDGAVYPSCADIRRDLQALLQRIVPRLM
jgi:toxin ParE1/3/4